jgi:PAS domain S-box-containing protein
MDPILEIKHLLTGLVLGVSLVGPIMFWRYWRLKRRGAAAIEQATAKGKHDAKTERVKSDIIISAIEDGVVVVGADKVINVFNQGAAKMTGWPSEEAEGLEYHSVFKFVDEKGQPYLDESDPFAKVFTQKKTVRDSTATLMTKSDKPLPTNISVSPLLDTDQNVTGAVAVFRDVTNERRQEQQRAEFISTASHEMRTPVAAIEGYLALALNDKVSSIDAKARGFLEKAHSSTQHLGKLFQDLLTSAKAEDGRLVSHPQVIEMSSFLEQVSDSLRFSAEKKGLLTDFLIGTSDTNTSTTTGTKVIQPLYYVVADPDRVREVITNLFDNAVKYTEKGKISIGLTGNNTVVQFYIQDTGIGVPAEDVPHLFQKFYRVDNSSTRTIGGTGLGLFITRKIIELYNGRIWVESEAEKGSTFYINLPRVDTQKATELMRGKSDVIQPDVK